jgi:hypothetical protein
VGLVEYDPRKTSQVCSNVMMYNPALISASLCIACRNYCSHQNKQLRYFDRHVSFDFLACMLTAFIQYSAGVIKAIGAHLGCGSCMS